MIPRVLTTREAETPEAKARWFKSLPLERRMKLFNEWTSLILAIRPELARREKVRANPNAKVQIVRLPRSG